MTYSREDFEDETCPKCKGDDVEESHNFSNLALGSGIGYLLDFPFGANYHCNKCEAENEDDCFVATVVYGNRNASQVQTLRDFRDNVLRQNPVGRAFVHFYYSGAGKRAAAFIRDRTPSVIPVIRRTLDCIVDRYSKQR